MRLYLCCLDLLYISLKIKLMDSTNPKTALEIWKGIDVVVGCSASDQGPCAEFNELNGGPETLEKWLVDVKCEGCKGLFYRSAPNVIVPDADWPRNGDVVAGYEIPNIPGASILAFLYVLRRS